MLFGNVCAMYNDLVKSAIRVFLALVILTATCPAFGQISIVVSKTSPHKPTEADLKNFFSGTKFSWENGATVMILDQSSLKMTDQFYKNFLGQTTRKMRKIWTRLVLSGQAKAPHKCKDTPEVKKMLGENPNAVGFIYTSELDDSLVELVRVEFK